MAVIEVKEGSTYTKSADGEQYVRVQHVTGVTGGTDVYLFNATEDAGVPDVGDAHPDPNLTHLKAKSVVARDLGDNRSECVTTYEPNAGSSQSSEQAPPDDNNENIIWNLSFGLEARRVTKDKDDAVTSVIRPTAEAKGDGPETEIIEIEKRVPIGILRGERRELNPPLSRMRANVGKVNSAVADSFGARTLLLTGITARTDNTTPDSAKTSYDGFFLVTYEFAYNPDTWDAEVRWTRFDGRLPAAYDAGSEKVYKVYEEVNFETALNIDLDDPS